MIRVLLVDDQNLVRQGIRSLLELSADICVCGEASDGFEGLVRADADSPDVILLDLQMPKMDGEELIKIVKNKYPKIIPKMNLGKKPKNCICIAEKINEETKIAKLGLCRMECNFFCKTPLNTISSPIAGINAIKNKLNKRSEVFSIFRNASVIVLAFSSINFILSTTDGINDFKELIISKFHCILTATKI